LLLAGGALGLLATPALAEPEYVTIEMEIDVDAPAAEVWSKVGGYCDIGDWFGIPCEITSGEGGIGTVRSLVGGRVIEVLVGQTDLSYGYTQPAVEGQHYNLYHGFLEAQQVTDETSKLVYTLMYDVSEVEDPEADVARRRTQFEGGLARMKEIAEADEEAEADAG
jgi:hypothetical protein